MATLKEITVFFGVMFVQFRIKDSKCYVGMTTSKLEGYAWLMGELQRDGLSSVLLEHDPDRLCLDWRGEQTFTNICRFYDRLYKAIGDQAAFLVDFDVNGKEVALDCDTPGEWSFEHPEMRRHYDALRRRGLSFTHDDEFPNTIRLKAKRSYTGLHRLADFLGRL